MKPGPVIAMVALVFLGIWLVLQPTLERSRRIDPAAHRLDLALGSREFTVEQRLSEHGGFEYHTNGWPEADREGWIDSQRYEALIASEMAAWEARPRWERMLKGFFNITSWVNFGWVGVGLLGQACFFGRMFIQWVRSEREQASVVPALFWWLSFFGGAMLFAYFVWRRDIVGVIGQSTGVVIYARNLRLIHKQRLRLRDVDRALQAASEKQE